MFILEDIKSLGDNSPTSSSNPVGRMIEIKKEMNNYLCLELHSENRLQWSDDDKRHFLYLSLMAKNMSVYLSPLLLQSESLV